ncbi:hypothetical protein [Arcobacter sp.]|uniref:hypothetical protein n=1 Tax=Arcobacter sp. TaxID=1872629 RepID=UPI003D0EC017
MTQYKIKNKKVNVHGNGIVFVNGVNTGIKQWSSDKKRYSSLAGLELKELRGLMIENVLELKGFL